uniref:Perilipin n=1 Tax=Spermophilus dauricus TaxID=99837 RepID=A0A8C9PNA1_SPEDA
PAAQEAEAGGSPEQPLTPQPSVVGRVASMPLISSTCDLVLATYASTKESHPHVKTVCDAAEKGIKTLTAAAVSGAQPILSKLEPQIASASEYAHRGLDKLEDSLPVLQQPTEKVLAETKELVSSRVSGAREMVSDTVSSAKDAVATRVSGAVDVTRGAVQSGVDMTKSMVTSGVHSVMGSRVGQMVMSGVDTVLCRSEEWMDNHLPMTDEELGECRSLSLWPQLKSTSQRACPSLTGSLLQMETVKQGVDQKLVEGQERLHQMWLSWGPKGEGGTERDPAKPEVELQALTMFRGITQQLQTTCASLASSIQGLPSQVKDQVQQARRQVEDLQSTFASIHSFQDLSGSILMQSREQVAKAREALDRTVEFVARSTPITWLVGPFAPATAWDSAPEQRARSRRCLSSGKTRGCLGGAVVPNPTARVSFRSQASSSHPPIPSICLSCGQ